MYNKLAKKPLQQARVSERLEAVITQATSSGRIVGTVVEVSHDGERIYRRAAGMADRESSEPVEVSTLFRWASLTKAVTSVAALILREQGKLALEKSVHSYLPNFQPLLADGTAPRMNLWHLMTHTSGLSYGLFHAPHGPYHRAGVSDGLDQPGLTMEENLRRLASVPLLFKPGTAWSYSLSTDVLGAVLAAVSGMALPMLFKNLITDPLGMTDTSFAARDLKRLATAYGDGPELPIRMGKQHNVPFGEGAVSFAPDRMLDPKSYASGGAGLIGTAADFLRFLEALRTRKIPGLSAESFNRLTNIETADLETLQPGWGWSLGWSILKNPMPTMTPQNPGTWRWGGVYGNSWFVDPAKRLSVVTLTNTAYAGMLGVFPDAIRDAVYL